MLLLDDDTKTESSTTGSGTKSINPSKVSDLGASQKIRPIPKARSLFLFNEKNRFRHFCHLLSSHRYFGNSILICILLSSFMLAMEDPVSYHSVKNEVIIILSCFKSGLEETSEKHIAGNHNLARIWPEK